METGAEPDFDMVDTGAAVEHEEPIAVPAPAPADPTLEDRLFHNITHVPYQPWCSLCVRRRARDDAHRRADVEQVRQKPIPVIQIDYCFLKSREQEQQHTVMIGIDSVYAMTFAVSCQQKGSGDSYAMGCLEAYCRMLSFEECYLQCDPEPSMCEVRNKICARLPRIRPRETPVGSKGSNGRIEVFHSFLEGLSRTLRLQVVESYGVELPTQHPIIGWCIQHASWLHDRFQPARADGKTAYFRFHHLDYGSSVIPFGETIVWRNPDGAEHLKLKEHWGYGIWLGREVSSDSHIVGTRHGCLRVRSVRRLPPSERADKQLLLAMVGGPGHLTRRSGKETLTAPPTPRVPGTPLLVSAPEASTTIPSTPVTLPEQGGQSAASAGSAEQTEETVQDERSGKTENKKRESESAQDAMRHVRFHPDVDDLPNKPKKRPVGRPPSRFLPDPFSGDYTIGCRGCQGESYRHSAFCREWQKYRHDEAEKKARAEGSASASASATAEAPPTTTTTTSSATGSTEPREQMDVSSPVRPRTTLHDEDDPIHKYHRVDFITEYDEENGVHEAKYIHVVCEESLETEGEELVMHTGHGEYALPDENTEMVDLSEFGELHEQGSAFNEPESYFDDEGTILNKEEVREGISRELNRMLTLQVGKLVDRSVAVRKGCKVWPGRWVHKVKPPGVRCRWVVKQFKNT
eukprot:2609006-Amphidinium_carterae.1